jgi:hypothetical protein
VASNFTNSVGKWNIYDLRPGQYTLCQKQQPGWSNTQPAFFAAEHQGWPCYSFDLQPDQTILTYFGYTDQALSAAGSNAQAALLGLRRSGGSADMLQDEMYTEETFVDLDAAIADDPGAPDLAAILYLPYAGR